AQVQMSINASRREPYLLGYRVRLPRQAGMAAIPGDHLHRCRSQVNQAAKLSPHEQCATAFGLVTLKPPFCRSSLKSRTDPLTNSALLGSTTIRTLCD